MPHRGIVVALIAGGLIALPAALSAQQATPAAKAKAKQQRTPEPDEIGIAAAVAKAIRPAGDLSRADVSDREDVETPEAAGRNVRPGGGRWRLG